MPKPEDTLTPEQIAELQGQQNQGNATSTESGPEPSFASQVYQARRHEYQDPNETPAESAQAQEPTTDEPPAQQQQAQGIQTMQKQFNTPEELVTYTKELEARLFSQQKDPAVTNFFAQGQQAQEPPVQTPAQQPTQTQAPAQNQNTTTEIAPGLTELDFITNPQESAAKLRQSVKEEVKREIKQESQQASDKAQREAQLKDWFWNGFDEQNPDLKAHRDAAEFVMFKNSQELGQQPDLVKARALLAQKTRAYLGKVAPQKPTQTEVVDLRATEGLGGGQGASTSSNPPKRTEEKITSFVDQVRNAQRRA